MCKTINGYFVTPLILIYSLPELFSKTSKVQRLCGLESHEGDVPIKVAKYVDSSSVSPNAVKSPVIDMPASDSNNKRNGRSSRSGNITWINSKHYLLQFAIF